MTTKHTPKPWKFEAGAVWNSKPAALLGPGELSRIATVHSRLDGLDPFTVMDAPADTEAEANGRLLAAAPELAEALRDALRALSCLDAKTRQNLELTIETARAVLAKLQGGGE